MELVSCFHPSRFFNRCPILLFAFSRYLFPSHRARKFPLLFPLNFCSRFVVVTKSFLPSRGCKGWMRRWRRPIISRREWPRISHFRRPLIEDRCTSRGSALYMDEGTTDHNDPPPRKTQWRTSSLQRDPLPTRKSLGYDKVLCSRSRKYVVNTGIP